MNSGRVSDACAILRDVVAINSGSSLAWVCYGDALGGMGMFVKALECYRKALVADPVFLPAWNAIGLTNIRFGRFDEAEFAFRCASLVDASYMPALGNLARTLLRRGAIEEARKFAVRAVELAPTDWRACMTLGDVYRGCNDTVGAIAHYRRAADLPVSSSSPVVRWARLLVRLGRSSEALRVIEERLLRFEGGHRDRLISLSAAIANRCSG